MNIDDLPIAWNSLLQVIVLITVGLVFWQIKTAQEVDALRRQDTNKWMFAIRRYAMIFKLLSLCWLVAYTHSHGWQIWPPFIGFLIAFDVNVVGQIFVMREDAERLRRRQPFLENGHRAR